MLDSLQHTCLSLFQLKILALFMTMELMPLEAAVELYHEAHTSFSIFPSVFNATVFRRTFPDGLGSEVQFSRNKFHSLAQFFIPEGSFLPHAKKNNHSACSHYLLFRCAAGFNLLFSIFILPISRLCLSSSVAIHTLDLFN